MLIQGPSGAGKSDLALRALAAGWRLVADDRTLVWASGARLFARAPESLRGLVEARGLGVLPHPALDLAPLALSVVLETDGAALERVPGPQSLELQGIFLPQVRLAGLEASAVAKLHAALACREARLGDGGERAYQADRAPDGQDAAPGRGGSTRNV